MPSTGIHLFIGNKFDSCAPDFFWVGCFAPDYPDERDLKNKIHCRCSPERMAELENLRGKIDFDNPFETGWLLHLYADYYWDNSFVPEYESFFTGHNKSGNWFLSYREEIGLASYYIYHNESWSKAVWHKISQADLKKLETTLPIPYSENERYRNHVTEKHISSDKNSRPLYFTIDKINTFSNDIVAKFKEWIKK